MFSVALDIHEPMVSAEIRISTDDACIIQYRLNNDPQHICLLSALEYSIRRSFRVERATYI